MFIHTNKALITSFHIKKVPILCHMRWVSADPQFSAQRAREGVNRSGAWGLSFNVLIFYISPVWCFPILLYKYLRLREVRSLADRRVERIRWIELFGSVSLQRCHAAGCQPMAIWVQFFCFFFLFFTERKRLKNVYKCILFLRTK